MATVGALGFTARLGCLVRLSMQLGREHASECSLFKNNLRLLSHTLALNTPAYDWREGDVASTTTNARDLARDLATNLPIATATATGCRRSAAVAAPTTAHALLRCSPPPHCPHAAATAAALPATAALLPPPCRHRAVADAAPATAATAKLPPSCRCRRRAAAKLPPPPPRCRKAAAAKLPPPPQQHCCKAAAAATTLLQSCCQKAAAAKMPPPPPRCRKAATAAAQLPQSCHHQRQPCWRKFKSQDRQKCTCTFFQATAMTATNSSKISCGWTSQTESEATK
jgi:hypothetical protein